MQIFKKLALENLYIMLHKHFFIEMVLEGQFIQKFGQISQEWQICAAINTKQYLFRTKFF